MVGMIVVDASVLIAYLDSDDSFHAEAETLQHKRSTTISG